MKKKLAILLTGIMLASTLGACSNSEAPAADAPETSTEAPAAEAEAEQPSDTAESGEKKKIGVAMINITQPFFVEIIEAGNEAAEDYNVEVDWKSCEDSLDKQITIVENFIEAGYDCIMVDAVDTAGISNVVAKAVDAGIPVVSMAQLVEPASVCTLYSDYVHGSAVTELLWTAVGKEGTLGLIYGTKGNFTSDERQRGWDDVAAKLGIENVQKPSNFNPDEGYKAAQNMISANPDLKGFFSVSDPTTASVYKAVLDAEKEGEIVIASNDGTAEGIQAVRDGKYICTVLMGPRRAGYWNVKVGSILANGGSMEQIQYLPEHLIVTDETKDKIENEWKLELPDISIINPDEADRLNGAYREEFTD